MVLFLASHKDITTSKMAEMSLSDECDSGKLGTTQPADVYCVSFAAYLRAQCEVSLSFCEQNLYSKLNVSYVCLFLASNLYSSSKHSSHFFVFLKLFKTNKTFRPERAPLLRRQNVFNLRNKRKINSTRVVLPPFRLLNPVNFLLFSNLIVWQLIDDGMMSTVKRQRRCYM